MKIIRITGNVGTKRCVAIFRTIFEYSVYKKNNYYFIINKHSHAPDSVLSQIKIIKNKNKKMCSTS